MPKRIPIYALRAAKSPITIRTALLILMVGFVAYMIWRDINERVRNEALYHRLDRMSERWETTQAETDKASNIAAQTSEATNKQLAVLEDLTATIKEERSARQSEHREITRQLAEAAKANRQQRSVRRQSAATPQKCWQMVTSVERIGANDVVKREFKPVPCEK